MRIITGDECGLLKEVIPELSRPTTTQPNGGIHSGNARPSATSIQAAAAQQMQLDSSSNVGLSVSSSSSAVRKIEEGEVQSRQRGVISMAFVPANNNESDTSSSFQFATLRMNGVVQLWKGSRSIDHEEGHVTPAVYQQVGVCQSALKDITTKNNGDGRVQRNGSDEENENDASSSLAGSNTSSSSTADNKNKNNSTGWNVHQPIRPIAMVSSHNHGTSSSNSSNKPILACADSLGNISILHPHNLQKGIVTTYNAFELSTQQIIQAQHKSSISNATSNNAILTYTKGRYANTSICTALQLCHDNDRLAIGGRERGMRLLDISTGQLLWKAKNLPPDPQTLLQQPQWTTCIQSITMNGNSSDLLATGTAYKQVQIYDVRQSCTTTRRPVLYSPEGLFTHRITTLCQIPSLNEYTLAVGDATGDVHLIDMRRLHSGRVFSKSGKRLQVAKEEIGLGRLVGPGGSVRELVSHSTLPYVACVGLDRKVWTWDVKKRKMMDCIYLKQRLNCALFCGDDCWSGEETKDVVEDGDGEVLEYGEADEEWNSMREKELEEDKDEVLDYVDSDEEETASDSEEGSGEDDDSSEEEEEEEPTRKRSKKRQKR